MKRSMLRLTTALLSMALAVTVLLPRGLAAGYTDVPAGAWYAGAVDYVTAQGLMDGVGNGAFAPDLNLSRAQIVALFYRLAGRPQVEAGSRFQDVPADQWYAAPVAWADTQGIVNGTGNGMFSPLNEVNREQLAALIQRYVNYTGVELADAANPVMGFKDSWRFSEYALEGIRMVWMAGIMNGDSQHNFNPTAPVSRADAASIFMRLHQALNGQPVTVSVRDTTPNHAALTAEQKNDAALVVAQQIAAAIPKDWTDLDRVSMAASIVSYYCEFCGYTMEGKDYRTPYGVFIKGEFSCAGATRALGMVLTCMGYEWTHVNENQYSHQWCQLYMDGQLGFADGQIGMAGYGPHWAAE